jgi:uncharacterized membrane protein
MRALIFFLLMVQGTVYTVEVTDTGYAIISHELFLQSGALSYTYYVPFPITHLEVYADKTVQGEFTVVGRQTEITLHKEEGDVYCICEYYTWDITYKEGDQWWIYIPSMEESIAVVMPAGAEISYLVTESDFPSISEEKGRITLSWEYLPEEVFLYYTLSFEDNSRFMVLGLASVVLVLISGVYLYVRKRRSHRLSTAVLSVLNEREKKIVEYLFVKGRSRQAKISRDCSIPKTSLSKILIKMEERGIIKRKKDGNLTYCELDDNIYQ